MSRKDGMPRSLPSGTFICGGTPTEGDLAKVQEFAGALAQPTKHLTNLALIEQMAEGDDTAATMARDALAAHTLDPFPWQCDGKNCRSTRRTDHEPNFAPQDPHCQHRECYP